MSYIIESFLAAVAFCMLVV